jgi:hypothetical protein
VKAISLFLYYFLIFWGSSYECEVRFGDETGCMGRDGSAEMVGEKMETNLGKQRNNGTRLEGKVGGFGNWVAARKEAAGMACECLLGPASEFFLSAMKPSSRLLSSVAGGVKISDSSVSVS